MKKEDKGNVDPFYSEANMERLRKSIFQMETAGGTVHEVFNLDDEMIYSKLLEAEKEAEETTVRYTTQEIKESLKEVINKN